VVYRNVHHAHANTETIVGHATLATGAHPSGHGMVGNLWFDRETGFTTYNVEVRAGVVELSGFVNSYEDRDIAVTFVSGNDGVKDVINSIDITG
jgi:hypothetical protein